MRLWVLAVCLGLFACAPKPPDVPACEHLAQRLATDPVSGHLMMSPSPACMQTLGEPECGHCVWIVSGRERWIGEAQKTVQLQLLGDTGKKDAKGQPIYAWVPQFDDEKKPVMVSTWLNGKSWSKLRGSSVYLPAAESYAPLATYIINACKKMNCSDDVNRFKVKLDFLNGVSGAINNP